jgi:hypothetical protein
MAKKITLACVALVFLTCASSGTVKSGQGSYVNADNDYWITLPRQGSLVIIGATGRQLKRESEIDLAREDAARKASMYHGVQVNFESVQDIGANFFDYYAGSEVQLEYDKELEKYKERLVFNEKRDIMTGNGGVFIRFSYPGFFPRNISYRFARNQNGSPEWTTRPPIEIDGFMAGVGYSGKQFYLKDTFEKSCNAAAADLVSKLSTVVTTGGVSAEGHNSSVIRQQSKGRLSHFLILETWIDPKTQTVWTLAIARRAE